MTCDWCGWPDVSYRRTLAPVLEVVCGRCDMTLHWVEVSDEVA
jgi:hypothetical protein